MKMIQLTEGKVAMVDDEDYEKVNQHKYYAKKKGNVWYAIRKTSIKEGKRKTSYLHRIIITPPKGMQIDHINGDGLDNRKENLRVVTVRENAQNLHIKKSSCYPGVNWHKRKKLWQSRITFKGQRYHLGYFENEEQASIVYKVACAVIDYHKSEKEQS